MSSNYNAIVVEITNLRPHSNADRLVCTNIFGNNIIVGKETKIGDVGLLFPLEAQIGEEFAKANDLIRRKDENGKAAGGMFDQNRRVRAQTFRGEKSMGFYIPLDSLAKLQLTNLKQAIDAPILHIGDEVETYAGFEISKKYVIPVVQQPSSNKQGKSVRKKESRIIPEQFKFHFDTSHLGRNVHKIKRDSLVSVSWKFHGTSLVLGNVLVKKKLKWHEKAAKWLGLNIVDTEHDLIYASRRVIKNDDKQYNHFYKTDVWGLAAELFKGKLHKQEQVYAEICGQTPAGEWLQKHYDYGCKPNEFDVYIYRITQTNPDGVVTELAWPQLVARAAELGFKTCPEIFYGRAEHFFGSVKDDKDWEVAILDKLNKEYVYDQDSQFCKNKVPEEGVVVRLESGTGIENFKLKAFRFACNESKAFDNGETNMEDMQCA